MQADHGSAIALATLLRERGLRATPQRLAVLTLLNSADGHHLSADDVWRRGGDQDTLFDRSTAYRVLASLTDAGVISEVRTGDGVTRYEVQVVLTITRVIRTAGTTADVPVQALRELAEWLERDFGFALVNRAVLFDGICAECRRR